ncbi:hypothetical protein PG989_004320 [Apiospora arundinis]
MAPTPSSSSSSSASLGDEKSVLPPVAEQDEFHNIASSSASLNEHGYIPENTWRCKLKAFWYRNRGVMLVLLSVFFAASMDLAVRLLETYDDSSLHAVQILFLRHIVTFSCILAYGYIRRIPDHPLGARGVRGLLTARGVAGFVAVAGIYFSLVYLPLAEATVLTFLAPALTCYANGAVFRDEGFSWTQQLAGVVGFAGVVLVALGAPEEDTWKMKTTTVYDHVGNEVVQTMATRPIVRHGRMLGLIAAMLGVLGQAGGMVTIRMIGPRAHSLTSMNYSSAASVLLCGLALALIPGLSFALPTTTWQWILMLVVTVCGFMFQLLLTEGLAYGAASAGPNENGYRRVEGGDGPSNAIGATHRVNRAVGMMYTQVIFALIYDWSFFRHVPTLPSWAGILCIVLGAFWTGVSKK